MLMLAMLALLSFSVIQAQATPGVSEARYARLARGINLPFWFWYGPEKPADLPKRFADAEFAALRAMGFTFVRLPINLPVVLDENSPDLLNHRLLPYVDDALSRLLASDLAVIVDIHSLSTAEGEANIFSGRLEREPKFAALLERFWESFAAQLSQRDPERVFLAVLNEPVFYDDPTAWPPIQERLIAAMRKGAPQHTLIATSARWSNIDTFVQLQPLAVANVVYEFHFYDPFPFTHQGATWAGDDVIPLRNVPYPSSPEAVKPALSGISRPASRAMLRGYGDERWDAGKIEARIKRAAEWARQHEARIICTEFGTYSTYAPAPDRARWVHDTRVALEKFNIGWSMWEYDDSFGLVRRVNGQPVVDTAIAQALGVKSQ
jgi:hypothetical protein